MEDTVGVVLSPKGEAPWTGSRHLIEFTPEPSCPRGVPSRPSRVSDKEEGGKGGENLVLHPSKCLDRKCVHGNRGSADTSTTSQEEAPPDQKRHEQVLPVS
ncbi:hypothetical protein LIER_06518 [Lithospermum erythrorhizon]|uniref:Uncharacterized protein n=1 Tax=Lithospermum erythrorhizon TaxID=34254 RepID=A0AAV3P4L9_LITER